MWVEACSMNVMKKNGTLEAFDKSKIMAGCMRAGASEAVANKVADAVAEKVKDGIKTSKIGEMVIAELKKMDKKTASEFEIFFMEAMH